MKMAQLKAAKQLNLRRKKKRQRSGTSLVLSFPMFEQAKRNLIRFWSGDLFICTFIMMESQLRFGAS